MADTNILLRLTDSKAADHGLVSAAVHRLVSAGYVLCTTSQNLIEFWNVATRPQNRNGFGLTPAEAAVRVQALKAQFILLVETSELYPEWERLATAAQVSGKEVHDTRLVAFMVVHGVKNLLTLNSVDFRRFVLFAGIVVVEPTQV